MQRNAILPDPSAAGPPSQRDLAPRRSLAALDRLRRRLRRLRLIDGLVRCGLVAACIVLVSFVLDYSLVLPLAVRAIALAGSAACLVWLLVKRVIAPLDSKVADDDLALLVEDANPDLRQALITAVQLGRAESEGARYVSADLLASVVADVESRIQPGAFGRVLRSGKVGRRSAGFAALALALLAGAAMERELASVWADRNIFLGSARWPKGTVLEALRVPAAVAIGDDLLVEARLLRGNPRVVELRQNLGGDGGSRASVMERRERASWDVILDGESGDGADPAALESFVAALRASGLATDEAEESIADRNGPLARGLDAAAAESLAKRAQEAGFSTRTRAYDVFVHSVKNISQPLRFWIEGGDDQIGPFDVEVRLRPRIDMKSIRVSYRLPDYTGDGGVEHVQEHGHLKVPVGSRVTYRMASNIPVSRAFFVLALQPAESSTASASGTAGAAGAGAGTADGARGAAAGDEAAAANAGSTPGSTATEASGASTTASSVDVSVEEPSSAFDEQSAVWPDAGAIALEVRDGREFGGQFDVTGNGQYYFQLEDEHGFRSGKPERFRIQAIPDRRPQVRIVEPQRVTEEVSPDAKVRIRVSIDDDYGIRRAVLEGNYYPPGKDTRVPQSIPLPGFTETAPAAGAAAGAAPLRKSDVELLLDIAALRTDDGQKPASGARFEFFALAEDFGSSGLTDASGRPLGNIGESQVHLFEIVDKETLQRGLTDQLMVVRDQLRQLMSRQEAIRKDLEFFQGPLLAGGKIDREQAGKLTRHQQDQKRIGEGLERQVGDIDRILERMDQNGVGEEKWQNWVRGIRSDVEHLARVKSPGVESEIEGVRKDAAASPQDASRLSPVAASQRQIERDLRVLVMKLEEFGDRNALLQLLRDVRRRQAGIRDETRALIEGDGGVAPDADQLEKESR